MNRNAWIALAAGLLVGGGVGFIVADTRQEKKWRSYFETEIEQIRKEVSETIDEDAEDISNEPESAEVKIEIKGPAPLTGDNKPPTKEQLQEYMDRISVYVEEEEKQNEESDEFEETPDEDDDYWERQSAPRLDPLGEPLSDSDPYLITLDEFRDSYKNFNKVSITYFEGDDTLVDERNDPVGDPDGLVGDALFEFGDRQPVYVRNPGLDTDYEIVLDEGTYTQVILGMDE